MSTFIAILAIIGLLAAGLWLLSYAITVLFPFVLAIAIFVILKSAIECVDPKLGDAFEGTVGLCLFILIIAIIIL